MTQRLLRGTFLSALLLTAAAAGVTGSRPAGAQEALRPEVGKPLQKAAAALRARRFAEAQHDLAVATAVPNRTPDEDYVIQQMRAAIAQSSGNTAEALAADDALIASPRTSAAEKMRFRMAEISMAYAAHDYPRTIKALNAYFAAGGRDPQMETLLIQCYYLEKDYARAADAQDKQIVREERAGQRPTENQLNFLASAQLQAKDPDGYGETMVKLVRYYPKPDYWAALVHGLETNPNIPDRTRFDIDKIRLAVGLLKTTADFTEMSEIAIQQGHPAQAQKIIAQAYATGAFGKDPAAAREARLKAFADHAAATQKAGLAQAATAAAAAPTGSELVIVGSQYVDQGDAARGLQLMQQGLAKDRLPFPDEAKLHYGLALLEAGRKAEAIKVFRSIPGKGVTGELAQLWTLEASAKG